MEEKKVKVPAAGVLVKKKSRWIKATRVVIRKDLQSFKNVQYHWRIDNKYRGIHYGDTNDINLLQNSLQVEPYSPYYTRHRYHQRIGAHAITYHHSWRGMPPRHAVWYHISDSELENIRTRGRRGNRPESTEIIRQRQQLWRINMEARKYMMAGWHSITDEMMDQQGKEGCVYRRMRINRITGWNTEHYPNGSDVIKYTDVSDVMVQLLGQPHIWWPSSLIGNYIDKENPSYIAARERSKQKRAWDADQKAQVNPFQGEF